MREVGKAVDDGDGTVARERFGFRLLESAYHYSVEVAGKDTRRVLNRFAAAYLQVVR